MNENMGGNTDEGRTRDRTGFHFLRDEEGSVTAEFALVIPAVLVVLGLVISGVMLATERLTLTSAAADIVRLEARGDDALAKQRRAETDATVSRERNGQLLCITLASTPARGLLSAVTISGRACAAVTEETTP